MYRHRLPQRECDHRRQGVRDQGRHRQRRGGDRHGHQHRLAAGREVRPGGKRDPHPEGRLRGQGLEGHHRDLPAHRRGKGQDVRAGDQRRGGLYQDLHRLLQGRGHLRRRGAVRQARGPQGEDQGRGRHLLPGRCREVPGPGRGPSGHQPDRQAGEERSRFRLLRRSDRYGKSTCGENDRSGHRAAELLLHTLFPLQGGRRPFDQGWKALRRLQHRKRRLRPYQLRRAHRVFQGRQRGRAAV